MASPLNTGKSTVDLATGEKRVSKIRRDPPPVPRKTVIPDRDESDRRSAAIGIVVFTLGVVVIIIALGSWAGWSPSDYKVNIRMY
jgi:hypothetical protein